MSLATRCPSCSTVFRVVADQLKLRGGLVRCGRCQHVFSGPEHLIEAEGHSRFMEELSEASAFRTSTFASPADSATHASLILPAADKHPNVVDTALASSPAALPTHESASLNVDETPEITADFSGDFVDDDAAVEANSTDEFDPHDDSVSSPPHAYTASSQDSTLNSIETSACLQNETIASDPFFSPENEPLDDSHDASHTYAAPPPLELIIPEPHHLVDVELTAAASPDTKAQDVAEWAPPPDVTHDIVLPTEPAAFAHTLTPPITFPSLPASALDPDEPQLNPAPFNNTTDNTSNEAISFAAALKREVEIDHPEPQLNPSEHVTNSPDSLIVHDLTAHNTTIIPPQNDFYIGLADAQPTTLAERLGHHTTSEASFLAQENDDSPVLKISLISACVVALFLLILQAAFVWRDNLAASIPILQPSLAWGCRYLHCQLGFPRDIKQLAVESSDMSPLPDFPNRFQLSGLLRSRASNTLQLPVLELSLLDLRGQPILKKVLQPQEYLPNLQQEIKQGAVQQLTQTTSQYRALGITGSTEIKINAIFETDITHAIGYNVYIFYP